MPTLDDLKQAKNRRLGELRKKDAAAVKDFEVRDEGAIWLLRPVTQAARDWAGAHLAEATWFGGAIAVEHRYIEDILVGILGDRLTIA